MPRRASLSVLLLSILAGAGCGTVINVAAAIGSGGSTGSSTGATGAVGSGGSTGSAGGATGSGGSGGSFASTTTATSTSSGGATPGPWTFTSCVWANGADSAAYPGGTAIYPAATFTVTQQGSTLAVTYVDELGSNDALTFDQTTSTSAVLAPGATLLQTFFSGLCVVGPGDTGQFPAQMTATSGTLDSTSGAVFLNLQGTVAPTGPTSPCTVAPAPADMWIVCGDGGGWAPVPPDGGAPVAQIAPGTYMCGSDVATSAMAGGMTWDSAASGSGTLEITQDGSTMTAVYTGDSVDGTLAFSAASSTSAYAAPGQMMATPDPLPVEAGALVISGTTLELMFRGTLPSTSSSPGTRRTVVIACSM